MRRLWASFKDGAACGSVTVFGLRSMSDGLPRAEETDLSDMSETMDQLDRRLAELRHQIHDLGTEPSRPRLLRRAPRPPAAAYAGRTSAGRRPSRAGRRDFPRQPNGQAVAEGLGRLGSQIEQLLRIRERLLGDAGSCWAATSPTFASWSATTRRFRRRWPPCCRRPPPGHGLGLFPARPAFFEGA